MGQLHSLPHSPMSLNPQPLLGHHLNILTLHDFLLRTNALSQRVHNSSIPQSLAAPVPYVSSSLDPITP